MARVALQVGRTRRTRNLSPAQAGYVSAINDSMMQIRQNLKRVIDSINATSPQAMKYATQPIFDTSQMLVPTDTGELKNSGFHETRKVSGGVSVSIGYGRGGTPFYAAIVHERTDLNHAAPTQAKYLEEAVNRHIGEVPERYASYIKGQIGLK